MSPGRRHSGDKDGKGEKSSWRRRKDEVSIADRLNQPKQSGADALPPGSVLPGQTKSAPNDRRPYPSGARRPRKVSNRTGALASSLSAHLERCCWQG